MTNRTSGAKEESPIKRKSSTTAEPAPVAVPAGAEGVRLVVGVMIRVRVRVMAKKDILKRKRGKVCSE